MSLLSLLPRFLLGKVIIATGDLTYLIFLLAVAYVLFKKKYNHLHEEYLASLTK